MSGITSGSIIAAAGLAGQLVAVDRRLRAVSLAALSGVSNLAGLTGSITAAAARAAIDVPTTSESRAVSIALAITL